MTTKEQNQIDEEKYKKQVKRYKEKMNDND